MNTFYSVALAFIAGLLPSLLWLWFWLHEKRAHPEPRRIIALAFVGGMFSVFLALILEKISSVIAPENFPSYMMIITWAAIEELCKYTMAYLLILNSKANHDPIDNVIYMISVALGFAALENTLFILGPILHGDLHAAFSSQNLRFIGPTLVHTISSASVGAALAFAFKKAQNIKTHAVWIGLIIATTLHSLFNLFIIRSSSDNNSGGSVLIIFSFVWLSIIVLILLFEKVKRIDK